MSENKVNRFDEAGNVLWFILIGVALLAALTIVISRSGSSVDQSGDFEQRNVAISQMMRNAKSIEAAIQEMRLRGVSENDISFENTTTATSYTNANCDAAADRSFPDCLLYNIEGAGLNYAQPPASLNDGSEWIFNATNNVAGIGTTAPDLIMILQNIRTSSCTQINRLLGTSYAGDESDVDFTAFTGSYSTSEAIDLAAGQASGCINYDNSGTIEPFFYYTLIAR